MDQFGSVGTYYPWGEAKGTTNPQDTWSYATYWRDSVSWPRLRQQALLLQYLWTLHDPGPVYGEMRRLGDPRYPQSWNRYAYTSGDPVNWVDPDGTHGAVPVPYKYGTNP